MVEQSKCEDLVKQLLRWSAPPVWLTGKGKTRITLGDDPNDAWHDPAIFPPTFPVDTSRLAPACDAKILWFSLDAVSHHLIIEWRGPGHAQAGWRIVQCFEEGGTFTTGYKAVDWLRDGPRKCGGADGGALWGRFGQGKRLGDDEIVEFVGRIRMLRNVSDRLVADVLLPQAPFECGKEPPVVVEGGQTHRNPEYVAWLQKVLKVVAWAGKMVAKCKREGLSVRDPSPSCMRGLPLGLDEPPLVIGTGTDAKGDFKQLVSIPAAAASEFIQAHIDVTGENPSPLVFLSLLNSGVAYNTLGSTPVVEGGLPEKRGWALATVGFNNGDPTKVSVGDAGGEIKKETETLKKGINAPTVEAQADDCCADGGKGGGG